MATIAEALTRAVQYHQAGDLAQAEQIYRQVLQADPAEANALHLLGMLAHQVGQHQAAQALIGQALAIKPHAAEFHSSLAAVYGALGRWDEAVASYRQALRCRPDSPEAHNNLGNVLNHLGRLQEAVASFREALRLRPGYAEAHNNLGLALAWQGRVEEAIACYRETLRLRADLPQPHYNLGNAYQRLGRPAEAIACFEEALRLRPDWAEVHNNLGNALRNEGRLDEAVASCREALRLRPDLPEAHNNLGNALKDQKKLDEAVSCYRAALRFRPDFAEVHHNLGIALTDRGELAEAEACLREALRLQPGDLDSYSHLLIALNYDPEASPAELLAQHRRWAACCPGMPRAAHANRPDPDRPLRVGYASPDFREHPVASFIEPILRHHDAGQVEVFCYAELAVPDATTARLRALVHGWRLTRGLSDAQLAELIRADGIDLLVDLAGHMPYSRLPVFASKPAPIQATYLGYPNTTGLDAVDYRLTDAMADPPGEAVCHSEELWRLPGCYSCYAPRTDAPPVTPLPARSAGHVTFGALHPVPRLNDQVLDLWCRLLSALPAARLLLYRHTLTGAAQERLRREFERRGLSEERVELRNKWPAVGPAAYLGVYGEIDLALDTFPWSGHTTACEALWMGVPVLTLNGQRYAGRLAATVLACLGLEDCIARTPDEYVERGVRLAGDLDRLAAWRSGLRERMQTSPLCDGAAFTRRLEQAYRAMWQRWCAQHTTDS